MATFTSFLGLTLPAYKEFINSWDEPVNNNMEDIDAFCQDLHDSLVVSSSSSTYASLRGSLSSLAARLDVSINADGTIDLTNSPEVVALASSATKGTEASPDDDARGRFDRSDFEIYDARQSFAGGRFAPIGAAGPTAGFPEEDLDAGMAIRVADFGARTNFPVSSPQRPPAPGLVVGGAANIISAPGGIGIVRIDGSSATAVFNIDGYLFRVRDQIDFDYTGISPTNGNYVWIYVERIEANYGDANFLYNQTGGYATKDLRQLQSGVAGSTSGQVFQDGTALFNTSVIGRARSGDILVIESGTAAGKYVIDSVDSDIQVTIRGIFKDDVGGATWHLEDNHHPNIGAVETDSDPTTLPAYVAGRVYIGYVQHDSGGPPTNPVPFAAGGVYDSGWQSTDAGTLNAATFSHNLGVPPTDVQIFFRLTAADEVYPAIVERQVLTNFDEGNTTVDAGDAKKATMLLPSVRWHSTPSVLTVRVLNASTDPSEPAALFTDGAGTDQSAGFVRIICRR